MGNCISWDRNKSIWALRILSEVLLCTGIVSCVAAFTIEVRFLFYPLRRHEITSNQWPTYAQSKPTITPLSRDPPTLYLFLDTHTKPQNIDSFKRKIIKRYNINLMMKQFKSELINHCAVRKNSEISGRLQVKFLQ